LGKLFVAHKCSYCLVAVEVLILPQLTSFLTNLVALAT
jgi:hypothetical protein